MDTKTECANFGENFLIRTIPLYKNINSIFNQNPILLKFLKFSIVGFTGLFVDFGITWVCKEKIKLQKYIANSIGFIAATTTNYLLNRSWTFDNNDPNVVIQYGKFLLISSIGLVLNNTIIFLLNEKFKVEFYFSKLIAIGVIVFWNFFANYYFTFM